jgi:hypothetical protein
MVTLTHDGSRRLQLFYRITLLLPLLGLALAAAVQISVTPPDQALPYGGKATWVYPPFPLRGLAAYGVVLIWLDRYLRRGPLQEFEALLWEAPIAYLAASAALLAILVLAHGQAAEFVGKHAGWIGLSSAVHLAIGYGYVGLIACARNTLLAGGSFGDPGSLTGDSRDSLSPNEIEA